MLQINTEFLTNQLQKYFYTRDLTTLFHLTKKCSITEVSKKFLIVFTVGQMSIISHKFRPYISPSFLKVIIALCGCGVQYFKQIPNSYYVTKIFSLFAQKTLHSFFIFKEHQRNSSQRFLETFTLNHISNIISNEYRIHSQSAKYLDSNPKRL